MREHFLANTFHLGMTLGHLLPGTTCLESSTKWFPSLSLLDPELGMVNCSVTSSSHFLNFATDLDLLEVGNSGLTTAEQQTHFAFWAAANLGESISFKRRYTNDHDVWAGPLADGSTAVVLINWQNSTRSLAFNLIDVGFVSANAVDLITGTSLGKLTTTYTSTVAAHGSVVLKLSDATTVPPLSFTFYDAAAAANTLAGGATTRVVNSSVTVVGFIGNGGTLTINNVDGGTSGGTKTLSLDYINGDFTMTNTACSNCRNAFISVNGGTVVQVQMPISAQLTMTFPPLELGHLTIRLFSVAFWVQCGCTLAKNGI
ncbi:hypothetical protein C0995_007591 [Termitomyces sp. Mi166|nr:hypothetical protein C0995_007591 [Termitomyces sp. Mi166\